MTDALHDQIEVVESGYEYLLAYAAQGRDSDSSDDASGPSEIRTTLTGMSEAAKNIVTALAGIEHEFAAVTADDAQKALAAISLVLQQAQISSELIDNLNASIHLRALLTDLFLLDEAAL